MRTKLIQSKANFEFHLDGDNAIDAQLLAKTISDMAELAELTAKEKDPDVYLKLKVKGFENGSFQVDFSTVCEVAEQIGRFSVSFAGFAGTVVAAVKGILEIKKLLKGKEAKSIKPDEHDKTRVVIENNSGNVINVDKSSLIVITNERVDMLSSNLAEYVKRHNPTGGFSFTSGQDVLHCTPEDVEAISLPIPTARKVLSEQYTIKADLLIKKADLLGASAWEFRYNDHVISAPIKDTDFLNSVHSGAIIKAGDYITALLEISIELDNDGKPSGKEQYSVVQVYGGIQHDENLKWDV